jgi:plasmid stabilization system protein ParE
VTLIVWAPQALDDVDAIRDYLSRNSVAYATLTVARIVAAVNRLERHPRSGRIVPELGDPAIREIVVREYRIVHRLGHEVTEVLTVFHGARSFRLG